jgi:hypothetical protein
MDGHRDSSLLVRMSANSAEMTTGPGRLYPGCNMATGVDRQG